MTKATKRARALIALAADQGHIPAEAMEIIQAKWNDQDLEEQMDQFNHLFEAINKGGKYKIEATRTKLH